MNAKHEKSATGWVDPDDAPEWTDEQFARADLHENGVLVRRGRPPVENPKERITLRLDHDVAEALRASGKGWQTRVNEILRVWVSHSQRTEGSLTVGALIEMLQDTSHFPPEKRVILTGRNGGFVPADIVETIPTTTDAGSVVLISSTGGIKS